MKGEAIESLKPLCRKAAADSAVLLRNFEDFLPLKEDDKVALFGRGGYEYTKCGTGSGGNVNVRETPSVAEGLRANGIKGIDKKVEKLWLEHISSHPFDNGEEGKFATEPRSQVELRLSEKDIEGADKRNEKALIFISRRAGEEKEVLDAPGSFRLSSEEKRLIGLVTRLFSHVGLIFNTSHIMDMSWTDEAWCHGRIDAILYAWTGGSEGGNGLADVLSGAVTPSGHLADTVPMRLSDHLSDKNFGDPKENYYEEDIYVGYRYFETFNPKAVLYPFGFGLSYTDFALSELKAEFKNEFKVTGIIKNTGNYKGAQVLQVYFSAPKGKLGRPERELIGFAKTRVLEPGEEETLTVTFKEEEMAAYDDSGITGNKSCYVLEGGVYRIFAGFDVRSAREVAFSGRKKKHEIQETKVIRTCEEAMAPTEPFIRLKATDCGAAYENVPLGTVDLAKRIEERLPEELPKCDKKVTFDDVKSGKATVSDFVSGLEIRDLCGLVRGEGTDSPFVTPGTASAFGGLTRNLRAAGVPAVCCADGPSGLHMKKGLYATQIPSATSLACTWDTGIVEKLYAGIGEEMSLNNIEVLLGPGMNIHRHPLCGRNFEYFSEDPYLTGKMAAAAVKGVAKSGHQAVIKHFCANSQEVGRFYENNVISERALREIYLKAFETAVKEGHARSVMTSYNMVNGHHTSAYYDLTETILRKEWGFTGMVMTDWWARLNDVVKGGFEHNMTDVRSMVRAQNDIYMCVDHGTAETNARGDNLEAALKDGTLTRAELEQCAIHILNFILQL
ncbi:MAG: glycoside hydrolase family 3 C-terminal domain-containing protein [Lachnospiraceae bacterium]|nr:glycoside hydrolase family 3 C-terminal domain-containing protein [Lachnospiraceae bacterium]